MEINKNANAVGGVPLRQHRTYPGVSGISGEQFLYRTKGKELSILMQDGKLVGGRLVGYDPFNIILLVEDSLVMIPKHAISTMKQEEVFIFRASPYTESPSY